MPNSYIGILILVAILGAIVAVFPVIPGLKGALPEDPTPRETLDTLITYLGILVTLMTLIFGLGVAMSLEKSESGGAKIEALLAEVRDRLGITSIRLLHDHEFYPHFRYHTETAQRSVYVCYFGIEPPGEPDREAKNKYYREHFEIIRSRHQVVFRRIVRATRQNKDWIRELVSELQGCGNAELAIYREQGQREMPLPLSVQVIDGEKAWFVAVSTHARERDPRDIFIENRDLAGMMEKYYNRLWELSDVIYKSGRLTREGQKYLEDEKEGEG